MKGHTHRPLAHRLAPEQGCKYLHQHSLLTTTSQERKTEAAPSWLELQTQGAGTDVAGCHSIDAIYGPYRAYLWSRNWLGYKGLTAWTGRVDLTEGRVIGNQVFLALSLPPWRGLQAGETGCSHSCDGRKGVFNKGNTTRRFVWERLNDGLSFLIILGIWQR